MLNPMRAALGALLAAAIPAGAAHAQFPGNTVKVGVLNDMSGPYADRSAARDPWSRPAWPPRISAAAC